jgi:hypothetical protein
MKKGLLVVVLFANMAFSSNFSSTLYGGLALAVGDGSSSMNPGINVCIDPSTKINNYFALGGHCDYTWLSAKNTMNISGFSAGNHFIDVGFVPKLLAPMGPDATMFFEVDPALFMVYSYVSVGNYSDSRFNLFFGLTYGVGISLRSISFAVKLKTVFSDNDTAQWIVFNVGIPVG